MLGISFSGGGIRSAAFCLGAYQALSRQGLFQRARFLSAVSGGSYIAGALTVAQGKSDAEALRGEAAPWSRGSPEEWYLRTNLSYLAPGLSGRLWLVVNFVYGLLLNLLPLVAGSYLAGRVVGLVYGATIPGIGTPDGRLADSSAWGGAAAACLFMAAVVLVGVRRFFDRNRFSAIPGEQWLRRGATALAASSGVVVILTVCLPLLVHVLGLALAGDPFRVGRADDLTLRLLVSVMMVLGVALLGVGAVLLMRLGRARALQGVLAFLSGWGVLAVPFMVAAEGEARTGWNSSVDPWVILAALSTLAVCGFFIHNRRYSMHLYYRERLSSAFVLRRTSSAAGVRVAPVPYDDQVRLSDVGREIEAKRRAGLPFPELVVCAAVAAREGDVPNKSWAASFTFDAERSGCVDLGPLMETAEMERTHTRGGSDLTLPSMMAISGAAISPTMGRFTLPALRLLMALANLRLGVWIPNPFRRADVSCPPSGDHSRVRRIGKALAAGWREPGGLYVLKEGLGLAGTRGRFIHVSDGGHWENLGLVELIRRRCTHMIVVDASAGGRSPLQDIARAAALARSDLGAEVRLNPEATLPSAESGMAEVPVAVGSVTYPDGSMGVIYYARCVLWDGVPMDLAIFREKDRQFPQHPTVNQLFSGEQFDAYRALGWEVASALAEHAHIPLDQFDAGAGEGEEAESILVM
ncbi:patatin-like phospholipase family protein [Modestobacter marinus]|uniref:patatin-like phospholipase family protein n=1 Tax=Modestobacter marinus TaxID=477641 RepID=UPI001C951306|nr:patatin-like phospholipase family protein [Modestobacter marinus]